RPEVPPNADREFNLGDEKRGMTPTAARAWSTLLPLTRRLPRRARFGLARSPIFPAGKIRRPDLDAALRSRPVGGLGGRGGAVPRPDRHGVRLVVGLRSGLRILVGSHERTIAALAPTAVLSGLTEAGILAAIAQVAAALVSGANGVHVGFGPLSLNPSI